MAINRKQLLRYTGAAAAGASLGVFTRGLFCPHPAGETFSAAIPGKATAPAPPGPAPPPAREVVGNESFSQCGEDLVVAFMAYYLAIPKVTYLDVGANDPVKFSNTYYFYKKGHRGVLVEPNRELCKRLRLERPADATVEAGIGITAAREADYYVMTFDGLNTFSKEEAEHQVETSQGKVSIQEVIKIPLLNVNDVMDEHFHGAPAFLSVTPRAWTWRSSKASTTAGSGPRSSAPRPWFPTPGRPGARSPSSWRRRGMSPAAARS